MRIGRRHLTVLMSVCVLAGSTRPATAGVWDWLEKLSGPGPFKGMGFSADVSCLPDGGGVVLPQDTAACDRDKRPYINVTIGSGFAKEARGFPEAQVVSVEPLLMFPLATVAHQKNWFTRAVDIGAGGGLFVFYGSGFDTAWRPSLEGSARFYFLRFFKDKRGLRFVRLEYTPKILFTYLSDERLGVPNRGQQFTPFDEKVELNGEHSLRLVFDFAVFQ